MMKKVGFIGWRGMVGSVLMQRLQAENNFSEFKAIFFSTSQMGLETPQLGQSDSEPYLQDAFNLSQLQKMDILVSCQGGEYTQKIHPQLRSIGWNGYWIDAASTLRMSSDSLIVLDPVNLDNIKAGITSNCKNYIGGNCTVSLLLMALSGLFKKGWIEWITAMTYQAVSGAGAVAMKTLLEQMDYIGQKNTSENILSLERKIHHSIIDPNLPNKGLNYPLAGNLLPWIDSAIENGQSREEHKAMIEANKILQTNTPIPIDGTCVRIGALRSHSQALTIKLNQNIPLTDIENTIQNSHPWIKWVPNQKENTLKSLTPASISGTLDIGVGRVRKMLLGENYLNIFTVGDQLLWGAAEPLRRMLMLLI